jgi:hypothetical protein
VSKPFSEYAPQVKKFTPKSRMKGATARERIAYGLLYTAIYATTLMQTKRELVLSTDMASKGSFIQPFHSLLRIRRFTYTIDKLAISTRLQILMNNLRLVDLRNTLQIRNS